MTLPFAVPLFDHFVESIQALPELPEYKPEHLCNDAFRLFSDKKIEMFYAPFDALNRAARVVLVGITPGFQQMEIAYRTARIALVSGASAGEACGQAKILASFAGTMRTNLITMLDDIGLHGAMGIASSTTLFDEYRSMLHTTSAIRYPVFVRGINYTGHNPEPLEHPTLRSMIIEVLGPELAQVPNALIIPLGKAVDKCLTALISATALSDERCLLGFPHPSGGNGHRRRQFEQNRDMLARKITTWFTSKK